MISIVQNIAQAAFVLERQHGVTQTPTPEFYNALRSFAARVLSFIPTDKPYGTELFDALNLLEPHFAFEAVLMRNDPESGKVQVYMMKRRDDDTAYPGEYHCPGSAVRNGEDWWNVAHRLGKGEFKTGIKAITPLHEAGFWYQESRGWYYSLPIVVELETEPVEGKWYFVDDLPKNTVHHHRYHIIPAAVFYWNNKFLFDAGQYLQRLALGLEKNNENRTRSAIAQALLLKDPKTPMGTEMYDAFTPHATNIAVEGVLLRHNPDTGEVEVYLPMRPASDKWYAGKRAGLGQGMRITDGSPQDALERLARREFGGDVTYRFVKDVYVTTDSRGWYECKVFIAKPAVMPESDWFPVNNMPENTVLSHRDLIVPVAAAAFISA